MPSRKAFSAVGRIQETNTREAGSRGTRSGASGIPTVYTACQELTKAGKPCSAPPAEGGRTCVGHARKESANAR